MKIRLIFVAFALCVVQTVAYATPITYTLTTYASGTLGASTFTDQLLTISYFGDTADLTAISGSIIDSSGVTGVDVAGLESAVFTDSTFFYITSGANLAGIYDTTASSTVGTFNGAFGTYAGDTSLGPLISLYYTLPTFDFSTTQGTLVISSLTNPDNIGVFQATLEPTPEPSSVLLLGTGAIGLLSSLRRHLKKP